MQRWEYKVALRKRKWGMGLIPLPTNEWDFNIENMLPALGEEGWELVSVASLSSYYGDAAAGTTTEQEWIFKRPKQ